jgi:hypothetical protein
MWYIHIIMAERFGPVPESVPPRIPLAEDTRPPIAGQISDVVGPWAPTETADGRPFSPPPRPVEVEREPITVDSFPPSVGRYTSPIDLGQRATEVEAASADWRQYGRVDT